MTNDSLAERLRYLLKLRDTNASALSEKAGLSRGAIRHMIARQSKSGDASARIETLRAIAKAAAVRPEWLIDGEGDPEDDSPKPAAETAPPASTQDDRISMIEAALVLYADRYHPETVRAARAMRMYRSPDLTREKLLRLLDILDKAIREVESTAADDPPKPPRGRS